MSRLLLMTSLIWLSFECGVHEIVANAHRLVMVSLYYTS